MTEKFVVRIEIHFVVLRVTITLDVQERSHRVVVLDELNCDYSEESGAWSDRALRLR